MILTPSRILKLTVVSSTLPFQNDLPQVTTTLSGELHSDLVDGPHVGQVDAESSEGSSMDRSRRYYFLRETHHFLQLAFNSNVSYGTMDFVPESLANNKVGSSIVELVPVLASSAL